LKSCKKFVEAKRLFVKLLMFRQPLLPAPQMRRVSRRHCALYEFTYLFTYLLTYLLQRLKPMGRHWLICPALELGTWNLELLTYLIIRNGFYSPLYVVTANEDIRGVATGGHIGIYTPQISLP